MNCFMGYNPLATKQVKVTVWVNEQDGATPVAPSNPSEGDCFIVYATDEAMLSNTPTSKKTYTNGDWAEAEGGGGGDFKVFKVTINADPEVSGSQYYVHVEQNEDYNYDGVFVCENGFYYISPYVGGNEGSDSIVVDLMCFGDSVTNVYLPSTLTASSGAIEYDEETHHYIISGDCSVTGWLDD